MPMVIRGMLVSDKDLNQRFMGTFIEIKRPGVMKKPEVIYVGEFGGGLIYATPAGSEPIRISMDKTEITREFPELGAVQYEGFVHYLSRLPLRQWSRGLKKNLITDFCRGPATRFNTKLDLARAEAIFNPTFTPLKEGLELIRKEDVQGFAYSSKFWFSGNKQRTYLWYEDVPVGEVVADSIFFNKECLPLKQEVTDEFKNEFKILV